MTAEKTEKPRQFVARRNHNYKGIQCITKDKTYPLVLETRGLYVVTDDFGEGYGVHKWDMTEVKEPNYAVIGTAAFYKDCGDDITWEERMTAAAEAIIAAYKEYAENA